MTKKLKKNWFKVLINIRGKNVGLRPSSEKCDKMSDKQTDIRRI